MIDIVCKFCNKKVIMQLDGDGELPPEMQKIVDLLSETPCSECVPTDEFIAQVLEGAHNESSSG